MKHLLMLMVVLLLCSFDLFSKEQKVHILVLEARDEITDEILIGAIISLNYRGSTQEISTGDDGRARVVLEEYFSNVEEGREILIQASHEGYERITDLTYTIQQETEPITLPFIRKFIEVTGSIKEFKSEKVLEGVEVSCIDDYETKTSKTGYFNLEIPIYVIKQYENRIRLTFLKDGYINADTIITISVDQKKRVKFISDYYLKRASLSPSPKSTLPVSTKKINGELWTLGNLNITVSKSWCYNNKNSCEGYGNLYTWEAANDACVTLGEGWRLPTMEEWGALASHYGGYEVVGFIRTEGNPRNSYDGLIADLDLKLGGKKLSNRSKFILLDKEAYFWTSSSYEDKNKAYYFRLYKNTVERGVEYKSEAMSCICIHKTSK